MALRRSPQYAHAVDAVIVAVYVVPEPCKWRSAAAEDVPVGTKNEESASSPLPSLNPSMTGRGRPKKLFRLVFRFHLVHGFGYRDRSPSGARPSRTDIAGRWGQRRA